MKLPSWFLFLFLAAATRAAEAPPATTPAPAPASSYNVRAFGATGDGATKDTAAFQKALDTCAVNGGGEVVVPAGNYLIGSIQMGTKTTLRFEKDAILTGSGDLADYPMLDVRWEGRWQPGHRALIHAANVDHIAITGPGLILGNATVAAPQNPRGAVVLEAISCNDVRWEGFTITQGGNWATHPTYCTDVVIRNMIIRGNRDGIDVDSCKNVLIANCDIETGDDCVSLKSGRGMDGARLGKPTENVLITNCVMRGRVFACIGIGSETSGGVRNIRIEHCKFTAQTHTIYIKTRIGRAGANENISGEDLDILGGDFLRVNLVSGGNTNTADDPVEGLVGYPSCGNLSFKNIRVNCNALVRASEVSEKKPIQGLELANITGNCTRGITLANAAGVDLRDIKVTGYTGPLLGIYNVTGKGLDGAETIPAPVDPPVGNARGGAPRGGRPGGAPAAAAPATNTPNP